jgi:hypothetical protein
MFFRPDGFALVNIGACNGGKQYARFGKQAADLDRATAGRIAEFEGAGIDLVHHRHQRLLRLAVMGNHAGRSLAGGDGVGARHVGIGPQHIGHGHVGRLQHGADIVQTLLDLFGIVGRQFSCRRIGAALRRYIQDIIHLDAGRIGAAAIRPSRRGDDLALGAAGHDVALT